MAHTRKKLVYPKLTKQAMLQRERDILSSIREENKEGKGFYEMLMSHKDFKAKDRLEAKGKIKWKKSKTLKKGYWVVKKQVKK